jgi:hypothetical protein
MIPNAGERAWEGKFLAFVDYVNSKFDPNTHTGILYVDKPHTLDEDEPAHRDFESVIRGIEED